MSVEIVKVPDIGDAGEVEVIELLVSVGDTVEENDSLLVLESDKAAMEIPAPFSGTVKSIAVNLGDKVTTGTEMMSLDTGGASSAESEQAAEPAASEPQPADEKPAAAKEQKSEPAAPVKASAMTLEIPDLGTDDEVEVIEVHVAAGDSIAVDDSLVT
ncbi:MAG: biotin/lipoyl-containing protein, partial [Gimesia chilikensis]